MGEKFQRVEIEMTAEQQADGRREVSVTTIPVRCWSGDETVYISYEEEMEGDQYRTLLTCGDGRFTMSRKGSGRQRMGCSGEAASGGLRDAGGNASDGGADGGMCP